MRQSVTAPRRRCTTCWGDSLSRSYPPSGDPLAGHHSVSCGHCGYVFWEPSAQPWREGFHYTLKDLYPYLVFTKFYPYAAGVYGVSDAQVWAAQKAVGV